MTTPAAERIATLDLVRAVAVLGILAVNIAGFAGPIASTDTPALTYGALGPATPGDEAAFALVFLVFEGKMRAIFSMLFGASMLVFMERAEARGRNGTWLQLRRLGWLAMFGWLHYMLLWWGDILFVYALAGMLALPARRMPVGVLVATALTLFALWHGVMTLAGLPLDLAEEHVRLGAASLGEHQQWAAALADIHTRMRGDLALDGAPFFSAIAQKWSSAPLWPLQMALYTVGETLPLMLLGMALYRTGFFSGDVSGSAWPRARLRVVAGAGLVLGGVWTAALLVWAWARHLPPVAMPDVMSYWAGPEHLAMGLGLMALLVLAAPRLLASRLGQRLTAAGRMAFSNYLLTTLVMTFLFHGWGLGLEGHVGRVGQLGFVVAGWALMLAWSEPWLARFGQGPLEWAWRSLTEWRVMGMRG